MNVCDSPDLKLCVAKEPSIGFYMYNSFFGGLVIVFLVVTVYAGMKQLTGAKTIYDVLTFLFRGFAALFLKLFGYRAGVQQTVSNVGDTWADIFLYLVGFGIVYGVSFLVTTDASMNFTAMTLALIVFFGLYFTTNAPRMQDRPPVAQVVQGQQMVPVYFGPYQPGIPYHHQQQNDIPVAEPLDDTVKFMNSAQSLFGGMALGILFSFVTTIARFFTIRPTDAFGDTMYIIAGLGIFCSLLMYYGSTLRKDGRSKRPGTRRATTVLLADGTTAEMTFAPRGQ